MDVEVLSTRTVIEEDHTGRSVTTTTIETATTLADGTTVVRVFENVEVIDSDGNQISSTSALVSEETVSDGEGAVEDSNEGEDGSNG